MRRLSLQFAVNCTFMEQYWCLLFYVVINAFTDAVFVLFVAHFSCKDVNIS